MKKFLIVTLIIAAVGFGFYFFAYDNSHQRKKPEEIHTKSSNNRATSTESVDERTEVILSRIIEQSDHKAVPVHDFDQSKHVINNSEEAYSHYMTPSSSIEIRDPDGNVLYKAEQDSPFVGIKSIVGGLYVAINRGDGRFRLINTKTHEHNDIPATPPIDRPIGFEWDWLDHDTLIGVSGVGYPDSIKQVGRCCDQHVVAASLLYLYDVNTRSLQSVSLPASARGLVFNIGKIADGSHIELVSASGHEDDGSSLGWYHISSK